MKTNIFFILFLSQISVFSQNDTVHFVLPKKNNFGIALDFTFNTIDQKYSLSNSPYPVSRYSGIYNYQDRLFLNAFNNTFLTSELEIYYNMNNVIIHSFGIGYSQKNRGSDYGVSDLASSGIFKNFQLDYQFTRILLTKSRVQPYIGVKINYYHKELFDRIPFLSGYVHTITDKSNLFLIQLPLGIMWKKRKFLFSICSNFNFMGIISGNHVFTNSNPYANTDTDINYSKIVMIDNLFTEKLLFSNLLLKVGHNF